MFVENFCDDYHNRDVTGKAKKELEVSQYKF